MLDEERCYRAVLSRDTRFDGWFYTAVVTTGIYCRPSCPATTPKRGNVCFYPSSAAAHAAGYRACKRCRPDAVPGSPEWDARSDVVARAMRLITDGVCDREGVTGLAARLGYSTRHLTRLLVAELGAGPLALARSRRAHTARVLLETSDLGAADVAFAAGFSSVRQFNDTLRQVYAVAPTQLRRDREVRRRDGPNRVRSTGGLDNRRDDGPQPPSPAARQALSLRLAFRPPLAAAPLLHFLTVRAVPGVEVGQGGAYSRVLALHHGPATVRLEPGPDHVRATVRLSDLRDLGMAVARCRRLLDLDADPVAVDDALGRDGLLAPLVVDRPGLRSPGAADPAEIAVRAVLGQQVTVAAARTLAGRLAATHGRPLDMPVDGLTTVWPSTEDLAGADPVTLPMPAPRAKALVGLCRVLAGDDLLHAGCDRDAVTGRLLALPGIGPWTAGYIRMRALGDPDVFLAGDLGVRNAAARLGGPGDRAALAALASGWSPWRSYALHHLWASLDASLPGA